MPFIKISKQNDRKLGNLEKEIGRALFNSDGSANLNSMEEFIDMKLSIKRFDHNIFYAKSR